MSDAPDAAPGADQPRGFGLIVPQGAEESDLAGRLLYVEQQVARQQLSGVVQQATSALATLAQQSAQKTGTPHPGITAAMHLTAHMSLSFFYEDALRIHELYASQPENADFVMVLQQVVQNLEESLKIMDRRAKLRSEEKAAGGLIQLGRR